MDVLKARRGTRRPVLKRLGLVAAAMAAALTALSPPASSQTAPGAQEHEIKAAFLYAFTRFVEWPGVQPGSADAPWQLCVLGDDPFGEALNQLAEEARAGGRFVSIRRFTVPARAAACHVLFVSSSEKSSMAAVLAAVSRQGLLTVSDTDDFAELGGVVQFLVHQHRVRFEINLDAARQADLRFSSRVLGIAIRVREPSGENGSRR
jgi:YfiR/HmsC-like